MALEELGTQDDLVIDPPAGTDEGEEVLDPGQLEGVKDKKEHEPPPTHPRFKQVYAEAKDNKRKVEELTQKFADTDIVFNELRSQNEQLVKTLQELQAGQQKQTETDQQVILQNTMASLKAQRAEALEADDHKKAYELNDQIHELTIKMHTPPPAKKEEPVNIDEALAKREVQQAVGVFTSETPWFNTKSQEYDPIMAGAAKEIDNILSADAVWGKKPVIDQLREVKRRVEERFGYKVAGGSGGQRFPGAAPVETGGGAARGSITLTPDQVKVSRMLFPNDPNPEAKYAEQLRLSRR